MAQLSPSALKSSKSCVLSIVHSSEKINTDTLFFKKSSSEKVKSNITYGTGFVYKNSIITNFHVIEQAIKNKYKILACNSQTCKEIFLTMIDKANDIAMLNLDDNFGCTEQLNFILSSQIREGDEVFVYGNKFGLNNSFSFGYVSGVNRNIAEDEVYHLIDANVGYGNSGGPIFLKNTTEILGVLKSTYSPSTGSASIALAIPSENVLTSIAKMEDISEFEKTLEFEILEKGDDIYFVRNNENVYFEKLPFTNSIQVQSINKKFVSSKVEVLYDIYSFIKSEEELLNITYATKDKKLKTVILKKYGRGGEESVFSNTYK